MRGWRRKLTALLITLPFFFLPTATRDAQRGKDLAKVPQGQAMWDSCSEERGENGHQKDLRLS